MYKKQEKTQLFFRKFGFVNYMFYLWFVIQPNAMNEETSVAVISPETQEFWAWVLKELEALAGLVQTHTIGKQTSVQEDELINKLWLRYQLEEG